MAGLGTLIRASDYNSIQAKIALNLGTGSGNRGYGQAVSSGQVVPGDKISVSQWANLRNDLLKARQHQTGLNESDNLTIPLNSSLLTEALRLQYDTMSTTIDTNRFALGAGQYTLENTISPATRTAAWNGTLTNTLTLNFASADHLRNFFNSGGNIQVSSALAVGSSTNKNNTWATMLSASGVVTIGKDSVSSNGSSPGTTYAFGYHQLSITPGNQTVYWKPAPTGMYAENDYYIYARVDNNQLIITSEFRDDDAGDQTGSGAPEDENVTGTLTNTVQMLRATGVNVSIAAPTASQLGF